MSASDSIRPVDMEELRAAIVSSVERDAHLRIHGMNSKRGWSRAWCALAQCLSKNLHALDMSGFDGIDLYEPEELILRAGAATRMSEIQKHLQENQQALSFEPPDFAPLYGGTAGGGTLGGVIACNLSGSRRVRAGAARDCVLGIEAVSGRGELFRSGGRVMKNVTGYDLPKLLTGSHGTLAAMTQITMKVLPASETSASVFLSNLKPDIAVVVMTQALSSAYEVSAAAYLPASVATQVMPATTNTLTVLRLEGAEKSLPARVELLRKHLMEHGDSELLQDDESRALWSFIGDARFFASGDRREDLLWRLFLPPSQSHNIDAFVRQLGEAYYFLDWGGGLAWLGISNETKEKRAVCEKVAAFALEQGGYGVLVRAPDELCGVFGGFSALGALENALMERVRAAFDPDGVFSPVQV